MITMKVKKIVKKMVEAGIHLGDSSCNPKMKPYIYNKKNNQIIINIYKTYKLLKRAYFFLFYSCRKGKRVLFVGTKKNIYQCIKKTAQKCDSWYIDKRWLGGFLTNWEITKRSISEIRIKKKPFSKNLEGVQTMYELPDIIIIVGQQKEINLVKECKKLEIPCVTILDTNCNPSLTNFFIPANDDSLRSVSFILNQLSKAIKKGSSLYGK
uniref:Small ribosomal subunit protein uS2c n=1 Tax=Callipsygma wilsonis TaxID=2320807 RepID=A0A386AZY0_9CHLO|nr:ribosomal protein S2 [Callipsygma wilsonis]AYC65008.1 ribosomal protein S2 [Callipsygma wilsonis]